MTKGCIDRKPTMFTGDWILGRNSSEGVDYYQTNCCILLWAGFKCHCKRVLGFNLKVFYGIITYRKEKISSKCYLN